MILIQEIVGNVAQQQHAKTTDVLALEWYETTRPIQRKNTKQGRDVALKFKKEGVKLLHGDILWENDETQIVVEILPTEAIVMQPKTLLEMGVLCYEIGNKHLPVFIENDAVLVPYEDPLFHLLKAMNFEPRKEIRILQNMLKTNLPAHAHSTYNTKQSTSLFSKILNMTSHKD